MVRALRARLKSIIAGGSAPAPWVAFFCSAKRKPRKKRPPGARDTLLAFLAPPGARPARRALNYAPRAQTRSRLKAPGGAAVLGARYGALKHLRVDALDGLHHLPSVLSSLRRELEKITFAITGVQKQSEATLLHVRVDGVVSLPLSVHLESELQVAVGLPVVFASVAKALGHAVLEV